MVDIGKAVQTQPANIQKKPGRTLDQLYAWIKTVYVAAGCAGGIMAGFKGADEILARLGVYRSSSGSCLYIKHLSDVDLEVLKELVGASVERMRRAYADQPTA